MKGKQIMVLTEKEVKEQLVSDLFGDGTLPPYDSVSDTEENPMCLKKVVSPMNGWEWYIVEGSEDDGMLFGYVIGNYPEGGSFTIDELVSAFGLCDKNYQPETLDAVAKKGHEKIFG